MCSPSMAMMAVGTGMQALGQARAGAASAASSEFNATVADQNARIARYMGVDAVARGRQAVYTHKLATARLKGEQQVAFASGGVALDVGSPLDLLEDTAALAAYDESVIVANAEREAYGYEIDAYNASVDGQVLRARADQQRTAGVVAALGTIAGGTGRILAA